MITSTLNKLGLGSLAASTLAVGLASASFADVERTCINGAGVIEGWAAIPALGIQFDLARGIGSNTTNDTRPAPGLFNNAWVGAQCNIPYNGLPIQQSIADAANVWSAATVPGTGAVASSFRINPTATRIQTYPDWMTWMWNPIGSSPLLSGTAGRNLVTFWEHPAVMGLFGGTTLGVALVSLQPGTGNIIDADLAFNAYGVGAGGAPLYRYLEDNNGLGGTITTWGYGEEFNGATPGLDPIIGYVDTFGVMVHEFGHVAGLAHSLIDGPTSQTDSRTPTMFAIAQVQPYTSNVIFPLAGCSMHTTVQANGSATQFGGIVGRPARTLEADDVSAVSVAYPGPGQNALSAISGQVVDANGAGVRAAHVVAVSIANPDVHRVGTFSDRFGNYTIGSLRPGPYFLMVEGADIGGYFAGTQLPEFIDPMFACGGPPVLETEYLDGNESSNEATPLAWQGIITTAGATTNVAPLRVEPVAGLAFGAASCVGAACSAVSLRGIVHNDIGSVGAGVELSITGGSSLGLGIVMIGADNQFAPFSGQLIEVNPLPGATFTVPLDAAGAGALMLPVNAGLLGTTFYAQGANYDPGTGVFTLAKSVALRLDAR